MKNSPRIIIVHVMDTVLSSVLERAHRMSDKPCVQKFINQRAFISSALTLSFALGTLSFPFFIPISEEAGVAKDDIL